MLTFRQKLSTNFVKKAQKMVTNVIKLQSDQDYLSAAYEAKKVLQSGKIVALPTDTIYGISSSLSCVDLIYKLKKRPYEKPLGLFVGNIDQIYEYGDVQVPRSLLEELLPGPVTLIFKRKPTLPKTFNPNVDKVGFRIPDSKFIQMLTRILDEPIAQTSANVSGSSMSPICVEDFEELWPCIDTVIDAGPITQHQGNRNGSTIVDLSEPNQYKIVREGCAGSETMEKLENYELIREEAY